MSETIYVNSMTVRAEPKMDWMIDGMAIKQPHPKSFSKAKISINLESFGKWLIEFQRHNIDNDYINLMVQEPYFQAKVSLKIDEFKDFIAEFAVKNPGKQWVNIDINEKRSGGLYAVLDTWEPNKQAKPKEESSNDSMPEWMKG